MNEELKDIIEEMELIEAYNERGRDADRWHELNERKQEIEGELDKTEELGAQYYGVTVFKGCQVVDAFTMWGESPEDLRDWLGALYEEIADSTPEAIDEYTIAYRDWNNYTWEPLNVDSYELFETVAELFHGVTVKGYPERSCRGLMESEEVNNEGEALDLAWDWLNKGLFVEVITDEDRTLYSPENFRDSADWRDNVIEHEFRENGVV